MALKRVSDMWTQCDYIYIRNKGTYWGGKDHKTNLYEVLASADNFQLGTISWFSRWRKYVFEPAANTLYEERCMRDISQFIEDETKAQIARARVRRKTEAAAKEAIHRAAANYIWVKCRDCKMRWKQEAECVGPRPCRKCSGYNTYETDVKTKAAHAND